MKYIRNLHKIDNRVFSVSPQTNKSNRVFVGIITICGSQKYCIPLSSPKPKHQYMKNSIDFSKIIVNEKLLGVLNYNLMIPVEEYQLQPIDLTIRKRDHSKIKIYKQLCLQELQWCQDNSEIICNKANVLYSNYFSDISFSARDRCVNFPKLEQECQRYNKKKDPK